MGCLPLNSKQQHGARLNPGNGGEGKGSRVSQDDNSDTHVDPEPQITTASILSQIASSVELSTSTGSAPYNARTPGSGSARAASSGPTTLPSPRQADNFFFFLLSCDMALAGTYPPACPGPSCIANCDIYLLKKTGDSKTGL